MKEFGLAKAAELAGSLKKVSVDTLKTVLIVMGIPNKLKEEVEETIDILASEVEYNRATEEEMEAEKAAAKVVKDEEIKAAKELCDLKVEDADLTKAYAVITRKDFENEINNLTKLLKKFS
ncbi:MAG: hypothetical protein ABIC57_01600 [bacterium]